MPALLEKFGLRLPYPENWEVDDSPDPMWPESVLIQTPGSAFWSLSIHPPNSDLKQLAGMVLDTMRREYEDVEVETVRETLVDTPLQGFNLRFYCLDLLVQAQLRAFSTAGQSYVVLCQGEDREFDRQAMVFAAMTQAVVDRTIADRVIEAG
jgi:hypothetical protein